MIFKECGLFSRLYVVFKWRFLLGNGYFLTGFAELWLTVLSIAWFLLAVTLNNRSGFITVIFFNIGNILIVDYGLCWIMLERDALSSSWSSLSWVSHVNSIRALVFGFLFLLYQSEVKFIQRILVFASKSLRSNSNRTLFPTLLLTFLFFWWLWSMPKHL